MKLTPETNSYAVMRMQMVGILQDEDVPMAIQIYKDKIEFLQMCVLEARRAGSHYSANDAEIFEDTMNSFKRLLMKLESHPKAT